MALSLSLLLSLLPAQTVAEAAEVPRTTPGGAYELVDGTLRRDGHRVGSRRPGGGAEAKAAVTGPCFAWDSPTVVAAPPPVPSLFGPVLHDSSGSAWAIVSGGGILAFRSNGHDGTWAAPEVAWAGAHFSPDATIAPNDDITIVYRTNGGGLYNLHAVRRPAGGAWQPPVLVHSTTDFFQNYDVIATAQNDVIVAFHAGTVFGAKSTRYAVYDHAAGSWGPAKVLSHLGTAEESFCSLRRSPDASMVVLGYVDIQNHEGITFRPWNDATKSFQGKTIVPTSSAAGWGGLAYWGSEMTFTVDNDGSVTVIWLRAAGGHYEVVGSRYESGSWGAGAVVLHPEAFGTVEFPVTDQAMSISATGEVIGVGAFRSIAQSVYELIPMHYLPGSGWEVGESLDSIVVGPGIKFPRARVVHYAGERAAVVVNEDETLRTFHYTGGEWGIDPVATPVDLEHVLSAGSDEALLVASNEFTGVLSASWLRGTTAFANLGGGLAGGVAAPYLQAFCDQVVGQDVTFELSSAAPLAPVFIVLGLSQVNVPFFGGTLVPAPDLVLIGVTDAAGKLDVTVPWPAGPGPAFTYYYQDVVVDPGAPQGLALSNALAGTTP